MKRWIAMRLPVLLVAVLVLAGCASAPQLAEAPAPTSTRAPEVVTEVIDNPATAVPEEMPAQDATMTPEQEATATPLPTPTAGARGVPEEGPAQGAIRGADSRNLFAAILGKSSAPEGMTLQPCDWDAPVLCVMEGDEIAGYLELTMYPLETLPDFQEMLDETGVDVTALDLSDPAHEAAVRAALQSFVEGYHQIFENDRQVEYGEQIRYERLETREVQVGTMPGLAYGFAGVAEDGSTFERWLSTVAFDGQLMYTLVAHYRPDSFNSFVDHEDLLRFEPHLEPVIAGLALPLGVVETEVQEIRALRDLEIFRAYGDGGNPVGQIAQGESAAVTGMSINGQHWRVDCPAGLMGNCWVAAGEGNSEVVR